MAEGERWKRTRRVPAVVSGKGGANKDDLAGADINKIVAQYRKNGTLPRVNPSKPLYGDFTGPSDLQAQLEAVQDAHDRFMELPADVRSAADNSPVRFLEMFDNEAERDLLTSAGLIVDGSAPIEPVVEAQPTPDAAPAAPATEDVTS